VSSHASVDAVMEEIQDRVRERLRLRLLQHGASPAFHDPARFAHVERLLREATDHSESYGLILPHLLGDPAAWRLDLKIRYGSDRGRLAGSIVSAAKRYLLMPVLRWPFEFSRANFRRQRRVNEVLFACVEELAIETARLREQVRQLSPSGAPGGSQAVASAGPVPSDEAGGTGRGAASDW
jgi:hypothetical protein